MNEQVLDVMRGLLNPYCYLLLYLIIQLTLVCHKALLILVPLVLPLNYRPFILVPQILPHHLLHQEDIVLQNASLPVREVQLINDLTPTLGQFSAHQFVHLPQESLALAPIVGDLLLLEVKYMFVLIFLNGCCVHS